MTDSPEFANTPGTRLYWLPASDRTLGFLTSAATPPATLSLQQSWLDAGGVYLLLAAAPVAADADFAVQLAGYLAALGTPQRFLWLARTAGTSSAWEATAMAVAAGEVTRRTDFRFGAYALTVPGETAVALDGANGFAFTGTGGDAAAILRAPGGTYPASDTLLLPLAGATPGAFSFPVVLPSGGAAPADFERLGVGIRYFFPDPDDGAHVRALALDALVQPSAALGLAWTLDPLRPVDPRRTNAAFTVPGGGALPAFGSAFATARGYGVDLTPSTAARLVFAVQPLFANGGDVPVAYYLTPQGAFAIDWLKHDTADTTGDIRRLLCGASGLEYLGMPATATSGLTFVPGQPAYCDMRPAGAADTPTLTALGTTAWVYPESGAAIGYYTQPEDAPLYQAPVASAEGDFLDFLELSAAIVGERAFPLAPYRGLAGDDVAHALALETHGIAPARRRALLETGARPHPIAQSTAATVGVTPQGLAVGVGGDNMSWAWLGVANQRPGANTPDLCFTAVGAAFQRAIEANRAFVVLTNADAFARAGGSVGYQLDAEAIAALTAAGHVPPALIAEVASKMLGRFYLTETDFVAALHAANPQTAAYELDFEREAGLLTPSVAGWRFRLSPRNWANNPDRQIHQDAVLIFKLATDRSLRDLAADLSAWGWPDAAVQPGATIEATQERLCTIFVDAEDADRRARESGASPYADFVARLDDPGWTGILALSCDVPLDQLPGPLQPLSVGVDPQRFHAHHVGFDLTPFEASPGVLSFGKTSMFGLIDYEDPEDQVLDEVTSFAFKVMRLTVGFRNSEISSFASRVQLMVNRMFGARAHLYPTEHGNNVVLDGVYQHQRRADGGDQGTYVFAATQQNTLRLDASALRAVVLRSAQLVTAKAADPGDQSSTAIAHFVIGGDMHFLDSPGFDPFSFGVDDDDPGADPAGSHLRFGNLIVAMEFTPARRVPAFRLLTETLSFDTAASVPRPKSLYATFPARLAGFVATPDPDEPDAAAPPGEGSTQQPESLGFATITAPLQQSRLRDPWFGLEYAIDLGTLGALSAGSGVTLTLLVAWSGGGTLEQPAVYAGVRLPGMKEALGVDLPLQGVMTLGFKAIEILVSDTDQDRREHILRLSNFALRFLGIAIPPGHNDFLLFGNRLQPGSTKVGWYAAYAADEDDKKATQMSAATRLAAGRRAPALPRAED